MEKLFTNSHKYKSYLFVHNIINMCQHMYVHRCTTRQSYWIIRHCIGSTYFATYFLYSQRTTTHLLLRSCNMIFYKIVEYAEI